jgi:hypothetical protein
MMLKLVAMLGAVLFLCACLHAATTSPVAVPGAADVLNTLVKAHPRLVLTEARLAELKKLAETDTLLAKGVADVIREADSLLKKPVLVHRLEGPRLLSVSRECVRRMYALGLAWRWAGSQQYADKARENLLAVCAFADWNPSHFLDTAEMSHAVAIGYDWFWPALAEADRAAIRAGLIKLGLEPGLKCYAGKAAGWVHTEFNWNQVCNAGLVIGALGIAETDGQYARQIIPAAVASLPKAIASYAPDGAWPEGPGYWGYATRYTVYGLAALQTALGTDFGLSKVHGLDKAGYFPIYTTGPTGFYFNFADVGGRNRRGNLPDLFWLSRRYNNPFFAAAEREMMAARRAEATDVIWYVPPPSAGTSAPVAKPTKVELARQFRGPVEVVVFRSAWDDPNALFLAVKAGYNQVNHGHLDLGSFELDALGVRWARELGSDNYNLPAYWGMDAKAQRWKYYRLATRSHSVPILDDRNQDVQAVAKVAAFKADPAGAGGPEERLAAGLAPRVGTPAGGGGFAVIDLGAAYKPQAAVAKRGVRMIQGRAVLVQDELDLDTPCQAAWAMTTEAKIDLAPSPSGASAPGPAATLTLNGRKLQARILSPAGAAFSVESAEQKPPEADNKGVSRLMIRVQAGKGPIRFAVLLSPVWPDGKENPPPTIVPLEDWK